MHEIEDGRISAYQLAALLILIRLVPATVEFPSVTGLENPRDAWIAVLVSTAISVPIIYGVTWLNLKFPGKNIIEYSEILLGKYLGKLVSVILTLYWLSVSSIMLRSLGEAYTVGPMPETPILVFILVMAFLSANAARNGLEVVGRLGEWNLAIVTISTATIMVLPYQSMRAGELLPVLEMGIGALIRPTLTSLAFFTEMTVLSMAIPRMNRPSKSTKASVYAVLASGFFMAALAVSLIMVFGPTVSSLSLPTFSLGRMISIGEFLERIEILPMGVWTMTVGVAVALFFWASSIGIAQILGLTHYKPLVYPLSLAAVILSIVLFDNFIDHQRFFHNIWPFSLLITVGIPAVLCIVYLVRRSTLETTGKDSRRTLP